jgi:hypothetical protein
MERFQAGALGAFGRAQEAYEAATRSNKALRDGMQLGDHRSRGRRLSACVLDGLEGIVSKRIGSRYVSGPRAWLKTKNPDFRRR